MDGGLSAVENSRDTFLCRGSVLEAMTCGPSDHKSRTISRGPSACRPRLTGEVAGGGSGNGFECGLFLWVPKDVENLFWLVDLTCIKSTKL